MKKNVAVGRLEFSPSIADSIAESEVIFIAVPTPPNTDGSVDLTYIEKVAREIAQVLKPEMGYKVIVDKSTVPVKTGEKVRQTIKRYAGTDVQFDIVSNPEFLREGCAVDDLLHPDRIVIGANSERAMDVIKRVYQPIHAPILETDVNSAELIKHAANTFLALEHDLEILPVVNKIDLPAADPKRVKDEIENIIGLPAQDAPEISAKVGLNIDAVLEDIVKNVPAPKGDPEAPLRALIFDSQYDAYRGVIVYFRVMEGTIKTGMKVKMMAPGASYEVLECGHLLPLGMEPCGELIAGEVGYFTASIKNVKDTQVGDTVTGVERPAAEALPGYRPARAMVYCGIYTEDGSKYPDLRDALEKLQLNDASLSFEPESSAALGFGFRCGFLGMLHMEIIQERLEREFDLDLITTLPSVIYRITKTDGTVVMVDNPHNYPDPAVIELAEEPYAKVSIVSPPDYVGNIMPMCQERRGEFKECSIWTPTWWSCTTPCLWARSSTTSSTPSRPAPRATPLWTTSWTSTSPPSW